MTVQQVQTEYRGYVILVRPDDFLVIAPGGDTAKRHSMSAVRRWVNYHRGERKRP